MRKLLIILLVVLVLAILGEAIGILFASRNIERLDSELRGARAEVKRLEHPIRLKDELYALASLTERKLRVAECFREEGSLSAEAAEEIPRLRRALEEARP